MRREAEGMLSGEAFGGRNDIAQDSVGGRPFDWLLSRAYDGPYVSTGTFPKVFQPTQP